MKYHEKYSLVSFKSKKFEQYRWREYMSLTINGFVALILSMMYFF